VCDWRAFPDDAARYLHRLLGHRIAAPNIGELRYDRLQLLLTMILDTGVVPTATSTRRGAPPTRATPPLRAL